MTQALLTGGEAVCYRTRAHGSPVESFGCKAGGGVWHVGPRWDRRSFLPHPPFPQIPAEEGVT